MKSSPIQYKVDINPSYEWAEEAAELNVSHRELEALALITEGYTYKEAADILKVKHQSVKNHVHSLHKKLDVKNNTQAYIIALHLNMIKMRSKLQDFVTDLTAEGMIDSMRKYISGVNTSTDMTEKDIRFMKVFLKEHGIDPIIGENEQR